VHRSSQRKSQPAEKITNFSPDKKFAVRIGYDPSLLPESGDEIPAEATRKLEVIAMPDKEVVLDFSDNEGGLKGKVIWSQDSEWFAYALSFGQRVTRHASATVPMIASKDSRPNILGSIRVAMFGMSTLPRYAG
jgi:hypothetical protein